MTPSPANLSIISRSTAFMHFLNFYDDKRSLFRNILDAVI